jgi:transcriptional regulator with XRE-family HTH domain
MTGGTLPTSPTSPQVMTDGNSGSRLGAQQRHEISHGLAAVLRAARRSRGWSLREAARRVGVAHGTIVHLEQGRRAPSAYVAGQLADAYGLAAADAEWLRSEAIPGAGKSSPLRARFGHGARPLSLVAVVPTGRTYGARGRVRH